MSKDLALVQAKDLSLVDDNSLNQNQLKVLLKRTPKQYVRQRPAKGGGMWDYVTGGYIKKCLNLMFGWDWDFEIIDEQILIEAKEVVVKGKLTCRSNGKTIVKMQYGNKDIIFKRGTNIPLSVGNDLKSACTDALKKCASEIGIASDVYNKEEFKEVKVMAERPTLETLINLLKHTDTSNANADDILNIERIIDQQETESYQKAINYLKKIK